jgi:hypothetical protein
LIEEIVYLFGTKPGDSPQILLGHTLASRSIGKAHGAVALLHSLDRRDHEFVEEKIQVYLCTIPFLT